MKQRLPPLPLLGEGWRVCHGAGRSLVSSITGRTISGPSSEKMHKRFPAQFFRGDREKILLMSPILLWFTGSGPAPQTRWLCVAGCSISWEAPKAGACACTEAQMLLLGVPRGSWSVYPELGSRQVLSMRRGAQRPKNK